MNVDEISASTGTASEPYSPGWWQSRTSEELREIMHGCGTGPLFEAASGEAERRAKQRLKAEAEAALEAAREAKYREIRDAELDFRTGKLAAEDYRTLDAQLRREAIEILDRIERLRGASGG